MLRIDLDTAGIPFEDAEGRVMDFHGLRHSFVSMLARSGVSPKVAHELARHSDVRLTLGIYAHTTLHDLAGAVASMPALLPPKPGPEALAATGTDGQSVANSEDRMISLRPS